MGNSLSKFIREHCVNWTGDSNGECLGVDVFSKPFRESGTCLVLEGKPCRYFKECVLGPEDSKYLHLLFIKGPAFEKRIRNRYQKIDATVAEENARRCPDCGAVLRVRQKYCYRCTKKRRQRTKRKYQQKYRKNNRGKRSTVYEK
jgi:hypothetical protein